jgi:hypothetical protein
MKWPLPLIAHLLAIMVSLNDIFKVANYIKQKQKFNLSQLYFLILPKFKSEVQLLKNLEMKVKNLDLK